MDNKQLINEFLDAFDKNDTEKILSCMTEDVQWNILGEQKIAGKEALRSFFEQNKNMIMVSSTRDHFIIDGDRASIGGEVVCKNTESGEEYDMYYCDVYELQSGKIKSMVTYSINKKKDQ